MTPIIEAIIVAGVKYGPDIALAIVDMCKRETVTLEEVQVLFTKVKRYEEFGIDESKAK